MYLKQGFFCCLLSEKLFILLSFMQNRRPDYLSIFMENLVSWDAVNARYEAAKAFATEREEEAAQN